MRVILARVGVKEELLDLVLIEVKVGAGLVVALLQAVGGFLGLFGGDLREGLILRGLGGSGAIFAEEFRKHVEAEAARPEGVGGFLVGGPLGLLAVDGESARLGEIDRLVEGGEVRDRALVDPLLEEGVDLEGRSQVAALQVEIERLAVAVDELVHFFGREVHLRAIEVLAVGLHDGVHVDRAHVLLADVELLEERRGGARLVLHRLRGGEAGGLGGGQRCQKDRQQEKSEAHKGWGGET